MVYAPGQLDHPANNPGRRPAQGYCLPLAQAYPANRYQGVPVPQTYRQTPPYDAQTACQTSQLIAGTAASRQAIIILKEGHQAF